MIRIIDRLARCAILVLALLILANCSASIHRSQAPLSDEATKELANEGLSPGARLFVRIFKLESQMEVWMRKNDGKYVLFRTYNICNWSGDIGPKVKEGDRQAPEGFYTITAKQMNPNSKYYLSFNLGYPNEYDKSYGRTGSYLMVHGGCLSKGCYAITDEAIQELFSLARDAFAAGQSKFPVHAYPFRMTRENMALRSRNKWYPFWLNLKQGYDLFEATKQPPQVTVSNGRYVFTKRSATKSNNSATTSTIKPTAKP